MNCCPIMIAEKMVRRNISSVPKAVLKPDQHVIENINKNIFTIRNHPGSMKPRSVLIPEPFIKAVVNATADYPVKALLETSEKLNRHLKGRVPPMEKEELKETVEKVQQKVLSRYANVTINNDQDESRFRQMIHNKTQNILREKVYNWRPIKFDVYNSLVYLLGRSAPEYAVLAKIFGEIKSRDIDFIPRSLFDFGSGVGTATWAAHRYWKQNIYEYFNVDISRDINDLAQTLLQGGTPKGNKPKGVFYRQFLPATKVTYDIVISAYSMMELPSLQARLETVVNLWNKTGKYLVIVEQGTNAGFKIVNEIRDFILQVKHEQNLGTVFSPCPHDDTCPRFLLDDGTPCNFEVTYFTLPLGGSSVAKKELYSYVILKKGKSNNTNPDQKWPRIIRPTLVRHKHCVCRMCTANGKLEEVIFTASKHGKAMYQCARSSKCGDLIPATIEESKSQNVQSDENGQILDDK
ncbi:unnamed protein product [Phaedon cochleariae]|uniref:Methyltransferase-like protein 17, mitochondrial n=1 Tax=Phaedon cochleariae TaxID=80249 RepID=A0A9N9SLX3_PHACE|nr:unnamed protein product [Phaedon cochleariae]